MRFGTLENNPLYKQNSGYVGDIHFTISDDVDENGLYVVEIDGDENEFFRKLGYHLASDVEKDLWNLIDEYHHCTNRGGGG